MIRYYNAILITAYSIGLSLSVPSGADARTSIPVYQLDTKADLTNINAVPTSNSILAPVNTQLFDLLEQLQYQVRHLTGKIELLEYELNQLKNDEKDRYIDLDRRINVLNQRQNETNRNNISSAAVTDTAVPVDIQSINSAGYTGPNSSAIKLSVQRTDAEAEKIAYKAAFSLIKDREYEQAKLALQSLINDFPRGVYTANSYYWLGEVFLVQTKYVQAVEAFEQVTTGFSKHRKVPDALYKIGVAYNKMGQKSKAKTYFQQVISNYPASSSARLSLNLLD